MAGKYCTPCRKGMPPLPEGEVRSRLADLPEWSLSQDGTAITRRIKTKNFAQALELVNRIGVIAEQEDHHPDIRFGWGYVEIVFTTHAANGLTENDFIMAGLI